MSGVGVLKAFNTRTACNLFAFDGLVLAAQKSCTSLCLQFTA